jgi:iron complex transport system ATP-binding protein
MDNTDHSILSFNSLEIGYRSGRTGRRILLPPLTASANRGELLAVIGMNGIGKSTLLRTILGLQPAFGGEILIKGEELTGIPRLELARRIGYISTEIISVSNMTVYDLVALGRFPHTNWIGTIDRKSREAIYAAMVKTRMDSFAGRAITELSDGERQRVMIARVLAQDTSIMVMDEPLAFLDLPGKYEIANLIHKLAGSGKTIIFSTHDLSIALRVADRIWFIRKDGIIEGTPQNLLEQGAFDSMFESETLAEGPFSGSTVRDYLKYFL